MTSGEAKKVILIGTGGMALDAAAYIADINNQRGLIFDVVALFSKDKGSYDQIVATLGKDVPLHVNDSELAQFPDTEVIITVGATEFIQEFRSRTQMPLAQLVSTDAYVARSARLGDGVIVAPGAFIGPYSHIGAASIVNATTTIGHETRLGEGCVISPGANIAGGCVLEDGVFIGSNVCLDPLVRVGSFSKIPSGSVVKTSIGSGMLYIPEKNRAIRMFNPQTGKSLFAK